MDQKRWQRIEELYHAALAVRPERRSAFLHSVCANSIETLREVESLLSANEGASGFLAPSAMETEIRRFAGEDETPEPGTDLGHYRIIRSIGAGGMGEVLLAFDTRLSRHVALKLLPTRFTLDSHRLQRFQREAQAASALNHPNIITIYEIGKIGDTHFIAAEYIEGITIRALSERGPIELLEAIRIVSQAATALEVAHRAGITHRDIKPENIMLRPDGLVKILDFGLARITDALLIGPGTMTESGVLLGTPRYMSPEQARAKPLDHRTDIFSLGVVLYEMVSGELPFPGSTSAEVFAALLDHDPKPIVKPACPPLDAILNKALAKDPEQRYASMQQFSDQLKAVQEQVESGKTYRLPIHRSPWMRGFAATIAALFVVWVSFAVWRNWWNQPALPSMRAVPLTSMPGVKNDAAFSPDGTRFAFVWDGGDTSKTSAVYTRGISSGEPVRITNSEFMERFPVWSPDGRSIAFLRSLPDGNGVFIVPAAGGHARKVTDGGVGLSWSPDGKWLAVVEADRTKNHNGITLLSIATGERRELTRPAPLADSLPAFSPDGLYVAFVRSFSLSAREVFVVPIDGGEPWQLTFDRRPISGLAWTTDSREVVLSSNRGTGESLWRVRARGGPLERIFLSSYPAQFPTISLRGNLLAFTEDYSDTNILRSDVSGSDAGEGQRRLLAPRSVVASTREDHSPHICPSGDWVVFVSKRSGSEEIWISDKDGARLKQLTSFRGPGTGTPNLSPDCRQVVFDSRASGNPDIYMVSADGGAPRQLTTGAATDILPSWSADGKAIYFNSNRGGNDQIWKLPVSGGEAVQITRNGAWQGFESNDGKALYYTRAPFVPGIWSMQLQGGPERPVPELSAVGRTRSWGVIPEGIYFATDNPGTSQSISLFNFKARRVTPFVTADKIAVKDQPALAVAPGGRWLLYVKMERRVNDIILLENFR